MVILHLEDRLGGVDHFDVNDRVDIGRGVILRDDLLAGNLEDLRPQVDTDHHGERVKEVKSGTIIRLYRPEQGNDPLLVRLDDPDRFREQKHRDDQDDDDGYDDQRWVHHVFLLPDFAPTYLRPPRLVTIHAVGTPSTGSSNTATPSPPTTRTRVPGGMWRSDRADQTSERTRAFPDIESGTTVASSDPLFALE